MLANAEEKQMWLIHMSLGKKKIPEKATSL